MLGIFKKKKILKKDSVISEFEIELVGAVLAYEIARSDGEVSKYELDILFSEIKKISKKVNKTDDEIFSIIETYSKNSVSFHEFIRDINTYFNKDEKFSLISFLWSIAFADSQLDVDEERLIRRIADLIRVKDVDVLKLKDKAKTKVLSNNL
jgi:uncharacterized tellurite resistance protein B-like protein